MADALQGTGHFDGDLGFAAEGRGEGSEGVGVVCEDGVFDIHPVVADGYVGDGVRGGLGLIGGTQGERWGWLGRKSLLLAIP